MSDDSYDQTPPHAAAIVESLRAFGYDLPTALADLIDNSISAGAENVWLNFDWDGARSTISVTDDGCGMAADELVEAMRLGTRGPLAERQPHDLGRFGLGLKTASLSQCRRLTVRSRRMNGKLETRCWDLDHVAATNDWRLLRSANNAAESRFDQMATLSHGTCVLWQNLDRLTRSQEVQSAKHQNRFLERIAGVRSHVGMVFHRLLSGSPATKIFINQRQVEPWDPFMEKHPSTVRLPEQPLRMNGVRVPVRAYILPHFSKLTKQEHEAGAGPRGWLAHQGFYVYRRNRLIVAGDWLGYPWTKDEHIKLARIAIDLPNSLDQDWQINVTKSRATPPAALRDELCNVALNARFKAKAVYTHRGTRLTSQGAPDRVHLWEAMVKNERTFYKINRDHPLVHHLSKQSQEPKAFSTLIRLLEETIPLQHIGIVGAEKPGSQSEPFELSSDTEIKESMNQLYNLFIAVGHGPNEAKKRLSEHSPFDQFPALLATFEQSQ